MVLMPSYFEPFGLVAAESISLNTPVVAYAVDGLSDVLKSNSLGISVKKGDMDQLHHKAREVLEKPPRAKWENEIPNYMDREHSARAWEGFYAQVAR